MTLVASLNSLQTIIYEKKGATAFVTLNRPAVLNALNQLAIAELRIAFEDIQNDPAIRGAILTGSGDRAFVAGADIAELSSSTPVDRRQDQNGSRPRRTREDKTLQHFRALQGQTIHPLPVRKGLFGPEYCCLYGHATVLHFSALVL
ncbi:enoyl-CoA hydratase-related protein [Rhizobium ruizarguesonis]|uniref:enoyl-CoA hydratase-related protein n=1 Tax=Rhizobium ruizarguesonis TaxID=2081791 RepID=UPI0009B75B02|nr:enoyl-CoA hydratase-related protein [Rhizobium ruizarguesonis]